MPVAIASTHDAHSIEHRALATLQSFVTIFSRLVDYPYEFAHLESLLLYDEATESGEVEFRRDIEYNFQFVQFLSWPLKAEAERSGVEFDLEFVINYINEAEGAGELNLMAELPKVKNFFDFSRSERLQFLLALTGLQSAINPQFIDLVEEKCLPEYMRLEYYGPTLDGQIYWVLIDYRGNLRLYSQLKHLTNNYTGDKGQDMRFIGASLYALKRLLEALQDDFNSRTLLIKQREKNSHLSPNNRVCTICQNSEIVCSNSNQTQTDSIGNNSDSMSCCDLCGFAQHQACFALLNIEDSINSSPSDTSFESPNSADEDTIASSKTSPDCDSDNANTEKCAPDEDEQSKTYNRKCLACLHQSTIEELEILHDFFKRRHQEVIQEDSRLLQKLKRQLKTARQFYKKCLQSKAKYESELANWEKGRDELDNSVSKLVTDQLTTLLQIINSNDLNLKKYMEEINLDSIEDTRETDTNKQIRDKESFCADLRYKSFNYHAVVAHLTDLSRCQKTGQRWKLYFSRKYASVYHHQQSNAYHNDSTNDPNQYSGDIEYEKDQLAAALDFDCTDSSPFVPSPSSARLQQGHFGELSSNNDELPTKTRLKNIHNDYQKFVGEIDDNGFCTSSNSPSTLDNNNNSVPIEYDEECSNDDYDGNSCEKNDQNTSSLNKIIDETGETSLMRRKRGRPKGSKTRAKMQINETTISKSISANSESYLDDTNKSRAYTRGPYKINDRLKRKNGHSGKTSGFGRGNQAQSEYNNQQQPIQPLNPNARKQVTSFSYNYIDAYQNQMKRMDAENLKQRFGNLNNGIIANGAAIDGQRNSEWQSRNKSFLCHEEQLEQNGTIAFGEKKRGYRRGTKLYSSQSNNNPFNMMFPQSNNVMNNSNYSLGEPNFLESSNIYFSPLNQTNLIYNTDLPDFDSEITKIPDELNEILQTISSTSVDANKLEVKSKPPVFIDNCSKNNDDSLPNAAQEVITRGRTRNNSNKNTVDENYKPLKDKNEVVQNAEMKMQTIGNRVVESSSEGEEEEEELDNSGHNIKQTLNKDENDKNSEFSWSQKPKKMKLNTNIQPCEANNYSDYSKNGGEEEAQKTWGIINLPEYEASDVNKSESHKDDDEGNEDELLSASSIHSEDIQDVLDSFFETGAANSVMAEAASNSKSPEEEEAAAVSMDDVVEELLSDTNNESQAAVAVASECYDDDDEEESGRNFVSPFSVDTNSTSNSLKSQNESKIETNNRFGSQDVPTTDNHDAAAAAGGDCDEHQHIEKRRNKMNCSNEDQSAAVSFQLIDMDFIEMF